MAELLCKLAHGNCTFTSGSTRVVTYALTGKRGREGRQFPRYVMNQDGREEMVDAGEHSTMGRWTFANFKHAEDQMLLIEVTKTRGRKVYKSAVVVRLRRDAALIQITAKTTRSSLSSQHSVPVFRGRADVLSTREANLLGARLDLEYIEEYMINADARDETLNKDVLAKEQTEKPVVQRKKVAGKVRTIVDPARKRRKIVLR